MHALLLATLLSAGADATPNLEGKWLIVYSEEGGRRNTAWEAKVATVKGSTLSYEREGKKESLELTFGPHQTVKGSFSGGDEDKGKGSYSGVYIAGRDYLCLSLNPAGGKADKGGKEEKGTDKAGKEGTGGMSSGAFILILRRQREK